MESKPRRRLLMVLNISETQPEPVSGVRPLEASDEPLLGKLLYSSYRGTIDDDYNGPEDADREAGETLAGRYGPIIWDASFLLNEGSEAKSAALVTNYPKTGPLLAF